MDQKVRQEIWIASYLVKKRFKLFKRALRSFRDQTRAPDLVVVSVCGEEAWRAAKWARTILAGIAYEIRLYDARWSQFDQLYMILKDRPVEASLTYITVCDDDDYFYPERIERQRLAIEFWLADAFKFATRKAHGDFGAFCVREKVYREFFAGELVKDKSIPPDVYFMVLLNPKLIDEQLHHRELSLLSREWMERRSDGDGWWTCTLAPAAASYLHMKK